MTPELSVVVIVQDGARRLRALLRSLGRQITKGALEVVVVDDGSRVPVGQSVLELAAPWEGRVVRRAGRGNRSAARNLGASAARGHVLLFLDGDQVAPPMLADEHLRYHRAIPNALVVGFRRHVVTGLRSAPWRPEVRTRVTNVYSQNFACLASAWYLAFSCNFSVNKSALVSCGGFDEGFIGWGLEDAELAFRLARAGSLVVHNPYAWTFDYGHVVRTDTARQREWTTNRDYFLAKHPDAEVQGLLLLDNYPTAPGSPGQRWLESYVRFEEAARVLRAWLPGANYPLAITVINQADLDEARSALVGGQPLRIVDTLTGSGLDLDVQAGQRSDVAYWALAP